MGCLVACAAYLLQCFNEGPTFAAEALEQRLLISILKSSRYLTYPTTPPQSPNPQLANVYAALLERTIDYLLYP